MEFDYKNPPKDCCPNVLCGQKKEDCCWVTKVTIAAVLGDDSDTSPVKPQDGAYTNKIVEYEANGAIYFYSSDGLWTKLGNKLPSAETASVAYVDAQDRRNLREAKDYTDAGDIATLQLATTQAQVREAQVLNDAKSYADGLATTTLNSAKDYTDNKTASILPDAKAYADAQDAITLQAAKDYTDSAASSVVTRGYVDTGDANTLETAKAYADQEVETLENSLATVATTGSYDDLTNTPDVPIFSLTTTDPGEGVSLAANHFIGVYS
jgi:hypothetical protein